MSNHGDILEGLKLVHEGRKVVNNSDDEEVEKGVPEVVADKKELDILLKLVDAVNMELKTKQLTLTPGQRNVVYTLTGNWASREKMIEGYNATLKNGFFKDSFNVPFRAKEFIENLEEVLGKKGHFELRQLTAPLGMGTGMAYGETRLFKVK